MDIHLTISDFIEEIATVNFHISLIFSIFKVKNSLVWLMVSFEFEDICLNCY